MTQIKITDAAGVTGVFTNPITVDPYSPPKPVTVFGTTPDYNNGETGFTNHMELYPKSGVARVYGSDCAQWDSAHVRALVTRGDRVWFSFKNFNLAPVIANWNAMIVEADYTPFHEYNRPSGGPVLADYTAFILKLFAARETHHNKALIKLGPIASWFPAVHDKEAIKWEAIMGQDSMPWDFMGWDQYNSAPNALDDPETFVSLPVSSGKKYGLPVQIGEWSVQPQQNDTGDLKAAQWLKDVATAYRKYNVRYVAQWCSQASGNPNYHLENRKACFDALQGLLQGK
jgi:hypothetical protein